MQPYILLHDSSTGRDRLWKAEAGPKVLPRGLVILARAENKLQEQWMVRREQGLCACWKQEGSHVLIPDLR